MRGLGFTGRGLGSPDCYPGNNGVVGDPSPSLAGTGRGLGGLLQCLRGCVMDEDSSIFVPPSRDNTAGIHTFLA